MSSRIRPLQSISSGRPTSPHLKVIGWGWFYLSTILNQLLALHHRLEAVHHDESRRRHRYQTLQLALAASGCDQARVVHKPRLFDDSVTSRRISPNGSTTTAWITSVARRITRKPRARSSAGIRHYKNRILLENYYLPGDLEDPDRTLRRALQSPPLPREPGQLRAGRRLLWARANHPVCKEKGSNATPSGNDD